MTIDTKNYKILLVDEDENDAEFIYDTLKDAYTINKTSSIEKALDTIKNDDIKIIISDQKFKKYDGIEFLKQALEIAPNSIRILITESSDSQLLINAINNAKIYRYIKKPCKSSELKLIMTSVIEYLSLKEENDKLIFDLKKLFTGTIGAITDALDGKNPYIFGKSRRVAFCAIKLAQYIGLPEEEVSKIDLAGLLHDIGMIGIPEKVLNKPGKFSPEEKLILKSHVENGISILKDIKQLKDILSIIKYHHEQYDGSGYPYGLKGEDIPIGSRIIAIADAYDGLISDRAYRKGFSHDEAIERLKTREGLDPNLVKKFIEVMNLSIDEFKHFEEELKNI
jgi:putative nucleotidyltransferase with HDIG domain